MRASFRIGGYVLLSVGVVALGGGLLGSVQKSRASASVVAVQPPSQVVQVGEPVKIDIKVSGVTNLAAWEVRFKYDPSVLAFGGFEKTDWMSSTGRSQFCPSAHVDSVAGTAQFGCNSANPDPDGPSGDGVVAHVTFTTVSAGVSDLALRSAGLTDPLGDPCCGTISVSEGAARVSSGAGDDALPSTPTPNPVTATPIPGLNDDLTISGSAQANATAQAGTTAPGTGGVASGTGGTSTTSAAGSTTSGSDIFSGSGSGTTQGAASGAPHAGTGTETHVPSRLAQAVAVSLALVGLACVLASRSERLRRVLERRRP